jgi:sec-independent protein translocase protein TatA
MTMNTALLAIGPLGTPEMIIIAVLILVLFGAKKLPTFARSLGRSLGEFKRAKDDFEAELHRSAEEDPEERKRRELPKSATETREAVPTRTRVNEDV